MEVKMASKIDGKSNFGRSGGGFLRFWEAFGGVGFPMDFRGAESLPKIGKMAPSAGIWRDGAPGRRVGRGPGRGFWSLTEV